MGQCLHTRSGPGIAHFSHANTSITVGCRCITNCVWSRISWLLNGMSTLDRRWGVCSSRSNKTIPGNNVYGYVLTRRLPLIGVEICYYPIGTTDHLITKDWPCPLGSILTSLCTPKLKKTEAKTYFSSGLTRGKNPPHGRRSRPIPSHKRMRPCP